MSAIGKSIGLGTAFLAGIAIAANAGPLGCADASASATITNPPSSSAPLGSGQPARRELTAVPQANAAPPNSVALPQVSVFGFRITSRPYSRSGVGPRVSSFETVRTEHYQVPEDYGANIALDPYKRGVSPRPGP
jgi:hypothetical protein